MKILVLNCGSSSIKYQLINMNDEGVLAKGVVERIGIDNSFLRHEAVQKDISTKIEDAIPNHSKGIKMVIDALLDKGHGVVGDISEIKAVGHRIVHGGEKFPFSTLVEDDSIIEHIDELTYLAPLHNPHNVTGIKVIKELLPEVPQVAVFDTSFHQTMEELAYIYPLPYDLYRQYGIRRYGFHGMSHNYVSSEVAKALGKDIKDLKIVTAHLGNGASITAIKNGKSMDTSMGFTPLEGLVMGTRCGNIDPAITVFLQDHANMTAKEVDELMNKKSGLLGISGVSNDTRDVEEAAAEGNKQAQLAIDMFCYRVKKYIGAYAAAMGGLDALIFTAGIGENSGATREQCVEGLEFLGVELDKEKNDIRGKFADISASNARVKTFVVPTNEELVIARETLALLKQ